ncbi:MAG: C39 family peptidase [Nannocystaceae bacterium]|nr:C39 family peptidase [Nannocystaceae bacterium]
MAKGWKLAWHAPKNAMVAEPLELSIEKSKDPPARVRIEIYESDLRKHEVDDYNDNLPKRPKEDKNDLVAKFEGSLTPRTPHGSLFQVESGGPQLAKTQANDHVVITFEGATAKFECGVPHDPDDEPVDGSSDGGFYEIFAQVFDADVSGGKPLATTDEHLVRRRTDTLLAVEPLNQCGATLRNAMGRMVLQFFHGGNGATANRQWGEVLAGTLNGHPVSRTICAMGCNYTVLTMALRYLRRSEPSSDPQPEGEGAPAKKKWITLFDEFVESDLDPAFKPLTRISAFPMFSVSGKQIEARSKALFKENKKLWKKAPTLVVDRWDVVPAGTKLAALKACRAAKPIQAHWWVAKVIWWVRKQESGAAAIPADADDTVQTGPTSWKSTNKDGTTGRTAATLSDGTPIVAHRMKSSMPFGNFVTAANARAEPPFKGPLKKALNLKVTSISIGPRSADWDERLRKHLDKGLPAIAHVVSGRYLPPDTDRGGHYILVVGYRERGGVLRFIVNDPAGVKKLQYECFRETDVTPTRAVRQNLTALTVSFTLFRDDVELGTGESKFTKAELEAALDGTHPHRTINLEGAAAGVSVKLVYEGGSSPRGTNNYGAFRYSVAVTSDGAALLSAAGKSTKASRKRKKQKSGEGAASHADGPIRIDLTFEATRARSTGTRVPRPWEDCVNGLVERRRHDSLFALHLLEPKYKWEDGAAQWLVWHGKAQ